LRLRPPGDNVAAGATQPIRGDAMRRGSLALWAVSLALAAGAAAVAQTRVKTQTVRPQAPPAVTQQDLDPAAITGTVPAAKPLPAPVPAAPATEVIADLSQLPEPVVRTRERILAAARTGELRRLVTVMQSGETLPIFSLSTGQDPITYWRSNYPDSDGVEILATLIDILETPAVHVDVGTPQEMYVWPYFARMSLKSLTPAQKVDLFKIVTGSDYKDMLAAGSYNFFRVGIGRDGGWRYFVTGN
jgi:hypothetical protein